MTARSLHRWLMLANIPTMFFTVLALIGGIFGLGEFDLIRILWMLSPLIVIACLSVSSHILKNGHVAAANVLAATPSLLLSCLLLAFV